MSFTTEYLVQRYTFDYENAPAVTVGFVLDVTIGGGGTTMPTGTAGQVPQVATGGTTYELKTPNTPLGLVRTDSDGTIPDILGPASWARDTEVTAAVTAHNGSGSAHSDIRALVAARSLPWTVDVVGAFGPGFDELVPGGAFGALDWGDDYYFYQTPSGENLTAQATEGTTIGCASYLLGAADGYAGDVTQEGVWTLTGGAWVRDTAQPRAGEIVSQDTGAAAWQLGNTYIKCSDGHLEHANLQYLRAIVATATVIETLSGDATLDATTSGAKTGLARCDATSAAFTATLVPAATNRGRSILFVKIDSTGNAVSVDADGTETINGSTSAVTLTSQWDWVRVTSDGTGWVATRGGSGGTVDKVSNVAQDRILGRTSSGSGDSEELTASAVRALLGVQPADRLPITTRSSTRYGSGYLTTQGAGSPLVPYEASTAPTAVAVAAGTLYFWPFSGLKAVTLAQLIIELTATSLTAGQAVTVGMWADAADGGPGTSLWSEAITTGASTGIFYKTGLAQSRPTSGWIGFLNPSGNAGSCTVRMAAPQGDRLFLLGSAVGQRPALFTTGQSAWPSDMSSSAIWNTSPLTFSGAAPIILAGA